MVDWIFVLAGIFAIGLCRACYLAGRANGLKLGEEAVEWFYKSYNEVDMKQPGCGKALGLCAVGLGEWLKANRRDRAL